MNSSISVWLLEIDGSRTRMLGDFEVGYVNRASFFNQTSSTIVLKEKVGQAGSAGEDALLVQRKGFLSRFSNFLH